MATPEQNALLALQLFQAPAQQFAQEQQARVNLAQKIFAIQSDQAEAERQRQFQAGLEATRDARARDASELGYRRGIDTENIAPKTN